MCKVLMALAFSVVAAGPSVASEETDVLVPIHQFVDSFNKGDATTAEAGYSYVTSIIDDFPPHEWHGAGACPKWMESYRVFANRNGIDDMVITLGNARHIDIAADRDYVVVPANYTLKRHGNLVQKTNSILTFALEKSANIWRVIGWAWADG